jgi:hypothetical protein
MQSIEPLLRSAFSAVAYLSGCVVDEGAVDEEATAGVAIDSASTVLPEHRKSDGGRGVCLEDGPTALIRRIACITECETAQNASQGRAKVTVHTFNVLMA